MFNECHIHLCDCTWLNVFHILNFCWSNTKRFLNVLIGFGKCFIFFAKMSKISKTVLPCSGDLVAGITSCMPPVASLLSRFMQLTGGSMFQLQKILRKFFKNLGFGSSRDSVWRLICEWKLQSWGYTEVFVAPFATSSWVDLPIAKNT